MSQPWVVDSNVGVVANRLPGAAASFPESAPACVKFLEDLMDSGSLALDSLLEIMNEYKNMRSDQQPGVGHKFLIWVYRHQGNPERCRTVDVTDIVIPDELKTFHHKDQKYIRTALGCPEPRIAEAVDGLWWYRRADFETAGIEVKFICPDEIKDNSDRKHGPS